MERSIQFAELRKLLKNEQCVRRTRRFSTVLNQMPVSGQDPEALLSFSIKKKVLSCVLSALFPSLLCPLHTPTHSPSEPRCQHR